MRTYDKKIGQNLLPGSCFSQFSVIMDKTAKCSHKNGSDWIWSKFLRFCCFQVCYFQYFNNSCHPGWSMISLREPHARITECHPKVYCFSKKWQGSHLGWFSHQKELHARIFDINLVKIHWGVFETWPFSCFCSFTTHNQLLLLRWSILHRKFYSWEL